jgi:hypothetical protein
MLDNLSGGDILKYEAVMNYNYVDTLTTLMFRHIRDEVISAENADRELEQQTKRKHNLR